MSGQSISVQVFEVYNESLVQFERIMMRTVNPPLMTHSDLITPVSNLMMIKGIYGKFDHAYLLRSPC